MMRTIMSVLGAFTSPYMILIFIRIMLNWFSGVPSGKPVDLLCSITDPYLNYFRGFRGMRIASLDLSPILALGILSVLNNIFTILGRYGTISLGIILAMILSAVWSAASFFISFIILILVLRLIAYIANRNTSRSFWGIIDMISQPILFRIRQTLFKNRIIPLANNLGISISLLLLLRIGAGILARWGMAMLQRLPI